MLLYEFFDYIEYAKAKNGKPFDVMIMGIDFPANDKTNPNHLASVDVYGSVYHFMTLNTVAPNYTVYFNDAGHFYPEVGVWISQRLMNENNKQIPPGFGILLTPTNLPTFLKQERIQLDND